MGGATKRAPEPARKPARTVPKPAVAALLAAAALALAAAPPQSSYEAAREAPYPLGLDGAGECTFPMKRQIEDRPWALQRLLLDELWADTKGRTKDGKSVRVAVIDTGVDRVNPQLSGALDIGVEPGLPRSQG